MPLIVRPDARDDLREAAAYYRSIPPPTVGKALALRFLDAFRACTRTIEALGAGRAEHPDIAGAHFLAFGGFPYLAFYTVTSDGTSYVVSIEYATSDYVERVSKRKAKP